MIRGGDGRRREEFRAVLTGHADREPGASRALPPDSRPPCNFLRCKLIRQGEIPNLEILAA